jgi:hypothetical protein
MTPTAVTVNAPLTFAVVDDESPQSLIARLSAAQIALRNLGFELDLEGLLHQIGKTGRARSVGDIHIDELAIVPRTRNCLYRANRLTVGALLPLTNDELLSIPNFGDGCLEDLIDALDGLRVQHRLIRPNNARARRRRAAAGRG